MKTRTTIIKMALLLAVVLGCLVNVYSQVLPSGTAPARDLILPSSDLASARAISVEEKDPNLPTQKETGGTPLERSLSLRPRINTARTIDFYLRTGEFVFGKAVSEDKNKVIVEQVKESKIIQTTYSKREIEPRTLQTKSIPEYRYYLDLAEYFAGRTWDFTDDPDDFIQAVRCCEKAKQSLSQTQRQDSQRINEVDERIKTLQEDRQVWERETESRAKLKTLEFEAEIEKRLKELEDKVNATGPQIDQAIERLDNAITEMNDSRQRWEQGVAAVDQDIYRRLNTLTDQVEANRRLIDPLRWYPHGYYYPRGGYIGP